MLTFNDELHEYRWNGRVVPSVSQILAPIKEDFSMVDSEVLEYKCALGKAVHRTIELFEKDRLEMRDLDPLLMSYLERWMEAKHAIGLKSTTHEVLVYSERYRYAGTLDIEGQCNRYTHLIDLKCTAVLPRSVGPQTAGYAEAKSGTASRNIRRGALHLRAHDWRYTQLDDPRDWQTFASCLNIHAYHNRTA